MKLLLDQNLSLRIIEEIISLYPNSLHIQSVGLQKSKDSVIWDYALEHNFTIVSKDTDFSERALLKIPPPKVIWIKRGNCSTNDIIEILNQEYISIK